MGTNARTFDINLLMKDAGLVAASAAAQVSSAAKILDLGSATAEFAGDLVIDTTAVETASGDELYTILVEGSSSASFASGIDTLAAIPIGHLTPKTGGSDVTDGATGRYILPFRNERNGTIYRYIRVYTVVAGTIATGINYTAYIAPRFP
jgi:hypothetical protein